MPDDDPLVLQTELDIQEIASRIKIFRDPELQPSAHSRLVEMFDEVGIRCKSGVRLHKRA